MKLKWLGGGAILVLGGVLVVLQEYANPDSEHDAAANSMQQPVLLGAGLPDDPASLKRDELEFTPPEPDELQRAAPAVTEPAEVIGDSLSSAQSSGLADVLVAAAALKAEGKADEAAQLLRDAMQTSQSSKDVARAGLFLAPLTTDLSERRRLLTVALSKDVVIGAEYEDAGQMLRELNHNPLNSLHPLVKLSRYTVASGDNLWTLCNKGFPAQFGVSPEVGLMMLVNGLSADTLRVGQVLLVPTAPLRLEVQTRRHSLTAWLGDVALATYRVGLGREGRTPRTNFTVEVRQEQPPWFSNGRIIPYGDPRNVLGTRWLGFDDQPGASGFGIHGTSDPESIGMDRSMGCIRLRNAEVEELFEYVARGTTVAIL
jgi:hypothetical protein